MRELKLKAMHKNRERWLRRELRKKRQPIIDRYQAQAAEIYYQEQKAMLHASYWSTQTRETS